MLYCVSLALSVSCLVFVIVFVFLRCSILVCCNPLFPSMYDLDGCATTAIFLVPGWVFTL